MKSASDVWICRQCRSINSIGSNRCYRCSTPAEVAAARPEDLTIAHEETVAPAVGEYHDTETRALVVSIAAIGFIASMLLFLWVNWQVTDAAANGGAVPLDGVFALWLPTLGAAVAIGVLTLLAYGFWISRVVENLPALGLGYSRVGPTWAFFESMLPGYNFMAIPARLAEVTKKAGGHPRVLPLIGLAILLPIVPTAVFYWSWRVIRIAGGDADRARVLGAGLFFYFAVLAISLLILLYVMWLVEGLMRSKAEAMKPATPRPNTIAPPVSAPGAAPEAIDDARATIARKPIRRL
jgi:hypothetical protein